MGESRDGMTGELEALLAEARAAVERLGPAEAAAAVAAGALIVDIRSELDRERTGIVPGSIHIPRTVLEWRLEPGGTWANPHVGGVDRRVIVICDHGYSSLLAAAALVRIGYPNVADVVGGFEAWRDAELPIASPPGRRKDDTLPGMGGPD